MFRMMEIADILNQYGDAYRQNCKLSLTELKVMNAIQACRTAKLGGHVERCIDCGHLRISYNSCRNRHCPKCQSLKKEKWLEERKKDLLPIQYFHVVFTIPDSLNWLTLSNKKLMYSILFKASSETLIELSSDPKYIGADIGFISILHTWGQNLMEHPHIHSIVTGGGLSQDKRWITTRAGFFIPIKVISNVFKGKYLYYLKKAYYSKKIKYKGNNNSVPNYQAFQLLIDELYEKDWVVYVKEPFKSAQYVLEYLGRYTHRVAITNNRIINIQDKKVTFRWRDYKDNNKDKLMTLDVLEFIRRFLLHTLPDRFVKIRHYGILSNRNRKTKLKECKKLLGVVLEEQEDRKKRETWEELLFKLTGVDYTICPSCGKGEMVRKLEIEPRCYSPPLKKVSIA